MDRPNTKTEPTRATANGQDLWQEYETTDGETYRVPVYSIRPGQSVRDVALLIGGEIVPPSRQGVAITCGLVVAVINSGGRYLPVVKR